MNAIRSIDLASRRTILLTLTILGALLLAAALVIEPPARNKDVGSQVGRTVTSSPPSPSTGGGTEESVMRDADAVTGIAAPADAKMQGATDSIAAGEAAIAPVAEMIAPPELDARIVRTGSIELRVKRTRFEGAWGDVQAVAAAHGGYVIAASRSGADDGPRAGSISMRIPTKRFDAAVDRLREVSGAKVRRLDVTSQDVTQEFVDVRSRLRHDRAVEARLLALLAQTKGVSEVLAVQSRLDQVQEQIELSKGRLDYLEKMTSMSTVEVTLTAPAKSGAADRDEERGVLGESLGDAKDRFEENVAGAIVWFGGALPMLVFLALIGFAGRAIWHRTRASEPTRRAETDA